MGEKVNGIENRFLVFNLLILFTFCDCDNLYKIVFTYDI